MKFSLTILGVVCLIASVTAIVLTEGNNHCLYCTNNFSGQKPSFTSYCKDTETCEYDGASCGVMGYPSGELCDATEDPACSTVKTSGLTSTPTITTITLPGESFCKLTVPGSSVIAEVTYSSGGETTAVFFPSYHPWITTNLKISPAIFSAENLNVNSIEMNIVNYDLLTPADFIIKLSDPNVPAPPDNEGVGSVPEWTAARDGKCLSCLNPHDTNPSTDPVYWCTDTNKCESGTNPTCNAVSEARSCVTSGRKQENPVCQLVSNLRLSKTPKINDITLPADSYCIIKLTGITQTMKVTYQGSGAVYYPALEDWDSTTLQPSQTKLEKGSNSRILQGSETSELVVAIVNYDVSSEEIFRIEAADSSVPDDDGLSAGQIAGIAIGCTFVFLGIVTGILWKVGALEKKPRQRNAMYATEATKLEAKEATTHQDTERATLP